MEIRNNLCSRTCWFQQHIWIGSLNKAFVKTEGNKTTQSTKNHKNTIGERSTHIATILTSNRWIIEQNSGRNGLRHILTVSGFKMELRFSFITKEISTEPEQRPASLVNEVIVFPTSYTCLFPKHLWKFEQVSKTWHYDTKLKDSPYWPS